MSGQISVFIFVAVFGAFLAGMYGERWLAKRARKVWWAGRKKRQGTANILFARPAPPITDAPDQLRLVMTASFEKRSLLSRSEARVFYAAEKAVRDQKLSWRVMAQVSLGEVLSSRTRKRMERSTASGSMFCSFPVAESRSPRSNIKAAATTKGARRLATP